MANTLTNLLAEIYMGLDTVAREPLGFVKSVYKNTAAEAASTGQTIRYPVTAAATTVTISPQSTSPSGTAQTVGNATITITKSQGVRIPWTGEEQKGLANTGILNPIMVNQFQQAFRVLANAIEADLAANYVYASRAVGVAGTTPFSSAVKILDQARQIVVDNGGPSNLAAVIDTNAGVNLRNLNQNLYVSYAGTDKTLRTGDFMPLFGCDVYESSQIAAASQGGVATTLSAAEAVGSTSLNITTTSAIKAGNILDITGDSRRYVAQTTATGYATLNAPGLVAAATSGTVITPSTTTYAANMVFDPNAIHLVTRVPANPEGGDMADERIMVTDPVSGITFEISTYKQYRQKMTEVAVVWGTKVVKPDFCSLILG